MLTANASDINPAAGYAAARAAIGVPATAALVISGGVINATGGGASASGIGGNGHGASSSTGTITISGAPDLTDHAVAIAALKRVILQ